MVKVGASFATFTNRTLKKDESVGEVGVMKIFPKKVAPLYIIWSFFYVIRLLQKEKNAPPPPVEDINENSVSFFHFFFGCNQIESILDCFF